MTSELKAPIGLTGKTVTARRILGTSVISPDLSCPEITPGVYVGDMAGSAGDYLILFLAAGLSVPVGSGALSWDGTKEITLSTINGEIGQNATVENIFTIPTQLLQSDLSPNVMQIIRGDKLSVQLPLMGDISGRMNLTFTCKTAMQVQSSEDTDSQAIFQIVEGVGLTVFLGSSNEIVAADGNLTVTNASTGAVTLTLNALETGQLPIEDLQWDCQWIDILGPHTPINGQVSFFLDVTQRIN